MVCKIGLLDIVKFLVSLNEFDLNGQAIYL